MCISTKILDMLYLMFISAHMVLKEKFGVINVYIYKIIRHVLLNVYICTYGLKEKIGLINVYIYKNIGCVVLNVYICTYGFERKIWCN